MRKIWDIFWYQNLKSLRKSWKKIGLGSFKVYERVDYNIISISKKGKVAVY